MAKKGLGKGLNSLFNEEDIEEVTSEITKSSEGDIKKVRMSLIEPNKNNQDVILTKKNNGSCRFY